MGNFLCNKQNQKDVIRKIYPSTSLLILNNKNKQYSSNSVCTQKYSILTFIPKNLFEQLHRFANIYFIFILILNFLPEIKAFGKEVAPIPVLFVLSVTAVKDLVEDYRRYQSDKRVNSSKCSVYDPIAKSYQVKAWKDVKCGDFVQIKANEIIPADILLFYSADRSGICHIETSNLDGESNLKQRDVVNSQGFDAKSNKQQLFHPEIYKDAYIEVEAPNKEIYKFNGTLYLNKSNISIPLRKNNVILRGCTMRNTEEVIGMVVYAGKETKAMLNNNDTRFKRSKLERQINKDVIWCALILIILCLSCSIGGLIWNYYNANQENNEFFKFPESTPEILRNPAMRAFLTFWTCVIYYQAMIPLPLYVTFEFVKLHQVFHIRNDCEMYDPEAGKGLEVRAFNIPEDLGQIQYVFSDKTGTLTENRMEFKRACIVGSNNSEYDYVHEEKEEEDKTSINGDVFYECNPTQSNVEKNIKSNNKQKKRETSMSAPLQTRSLPGKQMSELRWILSKFISNNEHDRTDYSAITGEVPHVNTINDGDDDDYQIDNDNDDGNNSTKFHRYVKDFFLLMAICNTTVVSTNKNEHKPLIKSKKPDLRSKFRKNFQLAGEGLMSKAASLSTFSSKTLFTKTGRTSFKNSPAQFDPNEIVITKIDDKHSEGVLELRKYERRESNRPVYETIGNNGNALKIVLENCTDDNIDNGDLGLSNTRDNYFRINEDRKVHSVLDFRQELYDNGCGGSTSTIVHSETDNLDPNKQLLKHRPNKGYLDTKSAHGDCGQSSNQSSIYDKHSNHAGSQRELESISDTKLMKSYESESPDEMALVKTACYYGYKLLQRGPNFVTIWNPDVKKSVLYQILQVLPFDSSRKRMSIIFQWPVSKEIVLFCKGADSAMFTRLSNEVSAQDSRNMRDFVDEYARLGLRTLVMGKRVIPHDIYESWAKRYRNAESKLTDNEKEMNELVDEIEDDMTLLGVTGIEDCLQEGVPDTIRSLRDAGITVWVLTGDKRETAINIAYSAGLFSDTQSIIQIQGNSKEEVHELIKDHLVELERHHPDTFVEIRQGRHRPLIRPDLALCIDGDALTHSMQPDVKLDLLHLAEQCSSVVCARSTPLQKAEIVQLVKENLRMQTLAIGDGANDVSMIQAADVGVGIGGLEGMQAVMASDFSMTKFKHLKRLLLVHGNWCYNKLARTALYMFYKDTIFILLMFWYQFHNAFSTSVMIDQFSQILFNITMTGLPPIIYGIWDKDLSAETLMSNPELYRHGVNCKTYKPWHFWANIFDSVFQSLVIFYLVYFVFNYTETGIWELGQIITACVLVTCLVHMGIETRYWTVFHLIGIFISFGVAWLIFTIIYSYICTQAICGRDNPQGFLIHNLSQARFWIMLIVTSAAAVLPRLVITAITNTVHPSLLSKGLQMEHQFGVGAKFDLQPEPELVTVNRNDTILNTVLETVGLTRPSSQLHSVLPDRTKELISPLYGGIAVSKAQSLVKRSLSSKSVQQQRPQHSFSKQHFLGDNNNIMTPTGLYTNSKGPSILTNNNIDKMLIHRRVKSYDDNKFIGNDSHENIYIVQEFPNPPTVPAPISTPPHYPLNIKIPHTSPHPSNIAADDSTIPTIPPLPSDTKVSFINSPQSSSSSSTKCLKNPSISPVHVSKC